MLFAFLRFFFSTCCYNKPTGLLLDTLRSELGQKVASQGQPLNKGARLWLAVLCEGRRHTMMMQETGFRDTLRNLTLEGPAALAKEEVQGGQWWVKVLIPGLCCSVLQSRYGPAEQCGVHTGQQWVSHKRDSLTDCCRDCTQCCDL